VKILARITSLFRKTPRQRISDVVRIDRRTITPRRRNEIRQTLDSIRARRAWEGRNA